MSIEFEGTWKRRGLIRMPVIEDENSPKNHCRVCGAVTPVEVCRPCRESVRVREHGTYAGYRQHQRRYEKACDPCKEANRVYQARRKRAQRAGAMNPVDRLWAQKQAVAWSWLMDERANRR